MIEDSNGKRFILRACHFERTMNQSPSFSAEINCLSVLNPIKGGKADDKPRFYASTKKMT